MISLVIVVVSSGRCSIVSCRVGRWNTTTRFIGTEKCPFRDQGSRRKLEKRRSILTRYLSKLIENVHVEIKKLTFNSLIAFPRFLDLLASPGHPCVPCAACGVWPGSQVPAVPDSVAPPCPAMVTIADTALNPFWDQTHTRELSQGSTSSSCIF